MGKQIYFYQTDNDILNFREFLFTQNLKLLNYDKIEDPCENISIWNNKRFFFIGSQKMIENGFFIEYLVPTPSYNRLIPEGRKGIEWGRFYLENNSYNDEDSRKTYNALVKYIRKQYVFSKEAKCYFSNDFIEMYRSGKYYITTT